MWQDWTSILVQVTASVVAVFVFFFGLLAEQGGKNMLQKFKQVPDICILSDHSIPFVRCHAGRRKLDSETQMIPAS
jgi:hypothetical protein